MRLALGPLKEANPGYAFRLALVTVTMNRVIVK